MLPLKKQFTQLKYTKKFTLFYICLFVMVSLCQGETREVDEYSQDQVTFALFLQMINFIEWPPKLNSNEHSIRIGVYEDKEVQYALNRFLENSPQTKNLELIDISKTHLDSDLQTFDIIYLGNKRDAFTKKILKQLQGHSILFVGSQKRFLEQGGTLNFFKKNKRIAFEINMKQSKVSGISFRAKLLRLAHRIKN